MLPSFLHSDQADGENDKCQLENKDHEANAEPDQPPRQGRDYTDNLPQRPAHCRKNNHDFPHFLVDDSSQTQASDKNAYGDTSTAVEYWHHDHHQQRHGDLHP